MKLPLPMIPEDDSEDNSVSSVNSSQARRYFPIYSRSLEGLIITSTSFTEEQRVSIQ